MHLLNGVIHPYDRREALVENDAVEEAIGSHFMLIASIGLFFHSFVLVLWLCYPQVRPFLHIMFSKSPTRLVGHICLTPRAIGHTSRRITRVVYWVLQSSAGWDSSPRPESFRVVFKGQGSGGCQGVDGKGQPRPYRYWGVDVLACNLFEGDDHREG